MVASLQSPLPFHQDRLIKKMGCKQIRTHEAANEFLQQEYLAGHNARFAREPAEPQDYHRPAPSACALDQVFCLETERSISNDWVVRYENRYLYPPRQAKVTVCEWEEGRIEVRYKGKSRPHREIAAPEPKPAATLASRPPRRPRWKPPVDHPWKAALLRATASAPP
jgi:hypothetical protein